MKSLLKITSFILTLFFSTFLFAQKTPKDDILFKKKITRAMDLREPQNKPLFSQNNELTRTLLQAVFNGKITPYKNDSLLSKLKPEDVSNLLQISENINWEDTLYMTEEEILDFKESSTTYYYEAQDLYQLELNQDWIINNKKSVLEKNNHSISFFIPADHPDNIRGIQVPLFTLDYEDCVTLWKNDPNAIWFNPYNDSEHLTLQDAFKLELYSSYIIKISNPDNEFIADNFQGRNAIIESKNIEFNLMEYESNLWEN